MELVETFLAIFLCGAAGIVAAVWTRQRRPRPEVVEIEVPRGVATLGYVLGAVGGGVIGVLVGGLVAAFVPAGAPDELPAYAIGPGIIIGAFAGGYVARTNWLKIAARREQQARGS